MRYRSQSWDFDVKQQGFRYHMSNIMAAIGIIQIDRLRPLGIKTKHCQFYNKSFKEIEQLILNFDYNEILPHIYVIKAQNRNKLREFLIRNNIECGLQYKPNHLHTKYTKISLPLQNVSIMRFYLYHVILI